MNSVTEDMTSMGLLKSSSPFTITQKPYDISIQLLYVSRLGILIFGIHLLSAVRPCFFGPSANPPLVKLKKFCLSTFPLRLFVSNNSH